jgi:hypothetical protein
VLLNERIVESRAGQRRKKYRQSEKWWHRQWQNKPWGGVAGLAGEAAVAELAREKNKRKTVVMLVEMSTHMARVTGVTGGQDNLTFVVNLNLFWGQLSRTRLNFIQKVKWTTTFPALLMLLSTAAAATASKKRSSALPPPAPLAPRQDRATTKTKQNRNKKEKEKENHPN